MTSEPSGVRLAGVDELAGLDPRSLAAFRVVLGLLLLGDLFTRLPQWRDHLTRDGVVPLESLRCQHPSSDLNPLLNELRPHR